MAVLESFVMGSIMAISVVLILSFAVLIKKGDWRSALRYGSAIVAGVISAELGSEIPESPLLFGLLRKLSILPLVISAYLTIPVARRAFGLLRHRSA